MEGAPYLYLSNGFEGLPFDQVFGFLKDLFGDLDEGFLGVVSFGSEEPPLNCANMFVL